MMDKSRVAGSLEGEAEHGLYCLRAWCWGPDAGTSSAKSIRILLEFTWEQVLCAAIRKSKPQLPANYSEVKLDCILWKLLNGLFQQSGWTRENARSKKEEMNQMHGKASISAQFLSLLLQENRQEEYKETKVTLKMGSPRKHAHQSIPDIWNQNADLKHTVARYC